MPRHRSVRVDCKRVGALHACRQRIAVGEHEARHAVGQRRLADALPASDQPGMGNPPAFVGTEQRRLGVAMAEQFGRLARMRDADLGVSLARAHAGLVAAVEKKRSRSVVHTLAATVLASPLASISTQRAGSAPAISR